MKNISEINPSEHGCFYFSPNKGEVSVHLFAPDENIEYTEYEAFECDNGTVIAFNRFNAQPIDYAYLLNCGGVQEIIQYQTYENIQPFLFGTYETGNDVFVYMSSRRVAVPFENRVIPVEDRCDKDVYGAIPFRELTDGVSDTFINFSIFSAQNMVSLVPILSIQGVATMWRIGLKTNDNSHKNYPVVAAITDTFGGLLRMGCEWRATTKEPFNNSEYTALTIAQFMDELGVEEEIEADIRNTHGSMPVETYITDPVNARNIVEIKNAVPDSFVNLVKTKTRYMTLASLSQNTLFNASTQLLDKEKLNVEESVYSFFTSNGVNPETISSIENARNQIVALRLEPETNSHAGIENHLSKLEYLWNR